MNTDETIEKATQEAGNYQSQQSAKTSELIRKIVFAIIGSCWVLIFTEDGTYQDTNIYLQLAIAGSFVYLILDIVHYFWDTCSYYRNVQNISKCMTADYIQDVYIHEREYIAKRSFVIFCIKTLVCLIVAALFLSGMFLTPSSKLTPLDRDKSVVENVVNN